MVLRLVQMAHKQSRQTTPPFCELSNDKFIVSKTVERAQLILLPSFNIAIIAISNERVSLFAVLCAVVLGAEANYTYSMRIRFL